MTNEEALLREMLLRKKASESMEDFASYITGFKLAPHQKIICQNLDRMLNEEIDGLIICAPPGSAKSTYTSLLFPPYFMAKTGLKIIAASHTQELADDFGKKARNLVDEGRFKNVFPDFELNTDSRASNRWAASNGAEYYGVGVQGPISGKRANILLIDDPYKTKKDAWSPTVRRGVEEWFRNDAVTRLVKPVSGVIIIQTRWHPDDLAGVRLQQMAEGIGRKYELLLFEAICENEHLCPLGRKLGEPLWEEMFPLEMLEEIRSLGGDFESLYQQRPALKGVMSGGENWFQRYQDAPEDLLIYTSWDTASTVSTRSDYTVGLVIGVDKQRNYYILDMIREKLEFPDLMRVIPRINAQYNAKYCLIENKGTGQSLLQTLSSVKGTQFVPINPRGIGDKVFRFDLIIPTLESEKVFIPASKNWTSVFLDEISNFPNGKHDDIPDALSQAIHYIDRKNKNSRRMIGLKT